MRLIEALNIKGLTFLNKNIRDLNHITTGYEPDKLKSKNTSFSEPNPVFGLEKKVHY